MGEGGGVNDIGQFFVADPFLVGDGLDGGAHQHGADRAALEEDDTQHPGDELGGSWAANEARGDEFGERLGGAGPGPDSHEPAQQPQVQQQYAGRAGGRQRGDQDFTGDVVTAEYQRAGEDAASTTP